MHPDLDEKLWNYEEQYKEWRAPADEDDWERNSGHWPIKVWEEWMKDMRKELAEESIAKPKKKRKRRKKKVVIKKEAVPVKEREEMLEIEDGNK